MNIVICLDDIGGMMMNNRRLSRDRILIEDLIETVGDNRLLISEYSTSLFDKCTDTKIIIDNNFLELANFEDFCFVEKESLLNYEDKIDKIILYKWNRRYPATSFFDLSLENWKIIEYIDFVGYSHEKITKEVYIK